MVVVVVVTRRGGGVGDVTRVPLSSTVAFHQIVIILQLSMEQTGRKKRGSRIGSRCDSQDSRGVPNGQTRPLALYSDSNSGADSTQLKRLLAHFLLNFIHYWNRSKNTFSTHLHVKVLIKQGCGLFNDTYLSFTRPPMYLFRILQKHSCHFDS